MCLGVSEQDANRDCSKQAGGGGVTGVPLEPCRSEFSPPQSRHGPSPSKTPVGLFIASMAILFPNKEGHSETKTDL